MSGEGAGLGDGLVVGMVRPRLPPTRKGEEVSWSGFDGLGLQPLGPESWGRRLGRARATAGYNLRTVEAKLVPHISRSTLDRLEQHPDVPTRCHDRGRAVMVLVLYGYDPTDFGLDPGDTPTAIDLHAIVKLRGTPVVSPSGDSSETAKT